MWTYNYTDELYHYGVLGMKWGVRKEYKPVGGSAHSFKTNSAIYGHRGAMRIDKRMAKGMTAKSAKRHENLRRLATIGAIGLGGAAATYALYHPGSRRALKTAATIVKNKSTRNIVKTSIKSKVRRGARRALNYAKPISIRSASYKKSISKGVGWLKKKGYNVAYKSAEKFRVGGMRAKNTIRTARRIVRNNPAARIVRNNPAMRTARNVKKSVGKTNIGKTALKTFAAATVLSDANSAQQWIRKQKKQGKITKKDVGSLAKDIVNPIPDNIPLINKNARAKRRANNRKR